VARLSILEQTLQQIDVVHQLVAKFPDQLGLARTSADVWRQFHAGKLASLIGVEGLHQIAGRASILRLYHSLGVRYVTLCHERGNEYVDSAVGFVTLTECVYRC
jgi:membrane dipeptidase